MKDEWPAVLVRRRPCLQEVVVAALRRLLDLSRGEAEVAGVCRDSAVLFEHDPDRRRPRSGRLFERAGVHERRHGASAPGRDLDL